MTKGEESGGNRNVSIGGDNVGGVVVTGDGNAVRASNQGVKTGGIRAGKIVADNVVDGVQVRGGDAASAAEMIRLAGAIRSGGITADEIRAGNVVTGLQYIADPASATVDDLRKEIAALREQVEGAAAAGDFPDAEDAEDAVLELSEVARELEKPTPSGNRIVRKLKALNEILVQAGKTIDQAGDVKSKLVKLLPWAAAVGLTAQNLFG
ncbi:MAG: hypothetical protein ACLFQQ_23455 [Desulfococcaceae bacterium]